MRTPLSIISQAQSSALFGFGSPYGLSGADTSYDFAAPGAVAEVKRALKALAKAGADPLGPANADKVTETVWQGLDETDVWDLIAAEEMLLFVSRFKNRFMGVNSNVPYMQTGIYPGGPQPTVNGLELLAGTVNERLLGVPKLALYEAWRGGVFAPPSVISRPAVNTPVTPTFNVQPNVTAPVDATQEAKAAVALADAALVSAWQRALDVQTEQERAGSAAEMNSAAVYRASAVTNAAATSMSNQALSAQCATDGGKWDAPLQTCRMPKPAVPVEPVAVASVAGGSAPWGVLLALGLVGGAAVYFARKRRSS